MKQSRRRDIFAMRLWTISWKYKASNKYKSVCDEEIKENILYMKKLSSKSSREDMCRLPTSLKLNIQSRFKQEVDIPQI